MSNYLIDLANTIESKKKVDIKKSYTSFLLNGGYEKCLEKFSEEIEEFREAIEKSTDKEDEENRIWYVGVTRTKQNLYIMAAKKEDKGYDIESLY